MKTLKTLIVIIALIVASCNLNPSNIDSRNFQEKNISKRIFYDKLDSEMHIIPIPFNGEYPKIIDSLGIGRIYDDTKWNLYLISYLDTCSVSKKYNNAGASIKFSDLELNYEGYKLNNDTIYIFFGFYYKKTFRCDVFNCDNIYPLHGTAYKLGKKSFFAYVDDNLNEYYEGFVTNKKTNSLRNIKKSVTPINSWFYNEAKKRGIIH